MIQRECSPDFAWSAVDANETRRVFACAAPRRGRDVAQDARDALDAIQALMTNERAAVVRQVVFLADESDADACRRVLNDFYAADRPATSYIAQSPCRAGRVAIEAWGVAGRDDELSVDRVSEHLVLVRCDGMTWAHCAGIAAQDPRAAVYDQAIDAFQHMDSVLRSVGFQFDQVFRTWLYLGDILGADGASQRYRELNRARADFYDSIRFLQSGDAARVYPASTGIGAAGRGLTMGCLAVAAETGRAEFIPLENPQQTPAFDYEAHYSPHSPKFSRAMAVAVGDAAAIFISGTASIVDSETKFPGDVARQTRQTLDNIEALIAPDNFARHGRRGVGAGLDDLALARVYVKRPQDYPVVRAECERRLGDVPAVYAVADICREDLLVEIEGVAFARLAPAS